jgi:stress-induced morphogen
MHSLNTIQLLKTLKQKLQPITITIDDSSDAHYVPVNYFIWLIGY